MNTLPTFFKKGTLSLFTLLWMGIGCNTRNNNPIAITLPIASEQGDPKGEQEPIPQDIVIMLGNAEVGKTSLLNAILQDKIFTSKSQPGGSPYQQKHMHEGTLYIDTPGLDETAQREQAAQTIENSLQHTHSYKIIFVATIKEGELRSKDVALINTLCAAVKTPFEYGLIVNKVVNKNKKELNLAKDLYEGADEALSKFVACLDKKPTLVAFLGKDRDMEEEEKPFFLPHDPTRTTLLNLLAGLEARSLAVGKVDLSDFEQRLAALERQYKEQGGTINRQGETMNEHGDGIQQLQLSMTALTQKFDLLSTQFNTLQLTSASSEKQLAQLMEEFNKTISQLKEKSSQQDEKTLQEKRAAAAEKLKRFKGNPDALHHAAVTGDIALMELLLDHGFSVTAKASSQDPGNPAMTPLAKAAYSGQVGSMQFLVDHGANVYGHDEKGCSPLFYAAQGGQVAALQFLLDKEADINTLVQSENRMGALHAAARGGHAKAIKFLLERKANVNMGATEYSRSPLYFASNYDHNLAVQVLLEGKADVNQVDNCGYSALQEAALKGNVTITQLLLTGKANVNIKNNSGSGNTPLYYASRDGHKAVVELLKKHGAQ